MSQATWAAHPTVRSCLIPLPPCHVPWAPFQPPCTNAPPFGPPKECLYSNRLPPSVLFQGLSVLFGCFVARFGVLLLRCVNLHNAMKKWFVDRGVEMIHLWEGTHGLSPEGQCVWLVCAKSNMV